MTCLLHNKIQIKPNRLLQLAIALALFIASSTPLLAQQRTLEITPQENGVVSVVFTGLTNRLIECGTENRYDSAVPGASTRHTRCSTSASGGAAQFTLTATPNPYYRFIGWLGDCTGSTAELAITLNADHTCQALFAKPDGYIKISIASHSLATNDPRHACAVLGNGQAHCWGSNSSGQLGDGSRTPHLTPTAVSNITNAVAISAGTIHTCAVLSNGQVRCWGGNSFGQIGDGTSNNLRLTPTAVSNISNAVVIAAGDAHTCAVLSDGQARCWGLNGSGQLGDGSRDRRLIPTAVPGIDTAVQITAGRENSCAVLRSGLVYCWGTNVSAQVGDGTSNNLRLMPTAVLGIRNAVTMGTGINHSCVVLSNGQARCWAANNLGQLGDGTTNFRSTATAVSNITSAVSISVGTRHTCAVLSDGQARCWGQGSNGKLGNGDRNNRTTPAFVTGLNTVSTITAGEETTCATLRNGLAYCWGADTDGVIGNGAATNASGYTSPQLVANQSTTTTVQRTAAVDAPFLFQTKVPAASGNWSISPSAPSGLRFNVSLGALYGTPTATSTATNYTLTATGATVTLALTIVEELRLHLKLFLEGPLQ